MFERSDYNPQSGEQYQMRGTRRDRRRTTAKTAVYSIFKNRRVGPRRVSEEQVDVYVDRHEPWFVYMAITALFLSICDAFFTLALLQHGSEELNPFMLYFIQQGETVFLLVKFSMTALCLLFLVMHKNFRFLNRFNGYHLMYLAFFMYGALVSYEFAMLVSVDFFSKLFVGL
ncbi:MAG: DUF5658 family protein [Gammaproteobacteria bacterium]|nr:DUF5658 family protein [Gammaproteobacteria bacterium]MDH5800184.1 DUF5658 family protein [Gammaproteobacteria bacterium]